MTVHITLTMSYHRVGRLAAHWSLPILVRHSTEWDLTLSDPEKDLRRGVIGTSVNRKYTFFYSVKSWMFL